MNAVNTKVGSTWVEPRLSLTPVKSCSVNRTCEMKFQKESRFADDRRTVLSQERALLSRRRTAAATER